jgi:lipopolysaccharide transport system ATP-binding protein
MVIKIEDVSKLYRLGSIGTGTLTHDVNRWIAKLRGKEDPYMKLGQANDRTKQGDSDFVWALKDINFEVKQGDVLGIVGKNGAGKSTLLKILSRTTSPTTGTFKAKGRIASLLEVGTGFHPELSGRENIFLNGAILGMTKTEIKSKFDEIVTFSGVERYIDTPVKRYSSGMYVRLAFAVAAHLEPEILIVDEVLAVGDQEFQNKCLGKMKDVSSEGRTVLFVSHNMSAIKNLCTKGILLENGSLTINSSMSEVINAYGTSLTNNSSDLSAITKRKGVGEIIFTKIKIDTNNPNNEIMSGKDVNFKLSYKASVIDENSNYEFAIGVWNGLGTPMFMLSNIYLGEKIKINQLSGEINFLISRLNLQVGKYTLNLLISKNNIDQDHLSNIFSFDVTDGDFYNTGAHYPVDYDGFYQSFSVSSL